MDRGVEGPPGFLEAGIGPQPAHEVILRDRTGMVGQQVFEYGQRFAVTAEWHGLTLAEHLEVPEETHLQRRLNNGGMFSLNGLLDHPPHGLWRGTTGRKRAYYGPVEPA